MILNVALKYTLAKYYHILIHFVLQTNVVRIYSQLSLVKKLSFSFMLPLSTFVAPISSIYLLILSRSISDHHLRCGVGG